MEPNTLAADPSKLSYFCLPGEIRNLIMEYVLRPGDIYPWRPVLETSIRDLDTTANFVGLRPGIQLMATCKQAYHEGHELFYSSNTFHLPPAVDFGWSERLQAKHKAMIKLISITFDLSELTPEILSKVERRGAKLRDKDWSGWGAAVFGVLEKAWKIKTWYIVAWTSLDVVELRSFGRTYIIANVGRIVKWCEHPYWDILLRSFRFVYRNIVAKVRRVGWEETKEWLSAREPGEMAEGFDGES